MSLPIVSEITHDQQNTILHLYTKIDIILNCTYLKLFNVFRRIIIATFV